MRLVLDIENFENNKYAVSYGTNKQALFTIVDEEYPGDNMLGRVNKITVLCRTIDEAGGADESALLSGLVIGIGNGICGAWSNIGPELNGKVLNKDNMKYCTVVLQE